jgi:hypothetical protein
LPDGLFSNQKSQLCRVNFGGPYVEKYDKFYGHLEGIWDIL